jgi:ATP-dependent Clp protease adaptor protein ClpS
MSKTGRDLEGWVETDHKTKVTEPPLYKVLLHNDDYTSMEFVVLLLEKVFNKSTAEATRIMLNVHQQGIGVAGVYHKEIAETKAAIVHDLAQKNEYPLRCSLEKV